MKAETHLCPVDSIEVIFPEGHTLLRMRGGVETSGVRCSRLGDLGKAQAGVVGLLCQKLKYEKRHAVKIGFLISLQIYMRFLFSKLSSLF